MVDTEEPSLFSPTHFQLKASYATKINNLLAVGVSLSWLSISHYERNVAQEVGFGSTSTILVDVGFLMDNLFPNVTYLKPSKMKSNLICEKNKFWNCIWVVAS